MDYVPTPPPTMNMHHRTIAFVGDKEFLSECRNHVISSLSLLVDIFKEDYISFPEATFYFLDPEKILGRRFTICYLQEGLDEETETNAWCSVNPDGKLYIIKNSKNIIPRAYVEIRTNAL